MIAVALLSLCLMSSVAPAPTPDAVHVGPVQLSVWAALIGVKRQYGESCPLGYKACYGGCVPIVSTCCEDGSGSYCDLTEYCTLGGCCPMLRRCSKYFYAPSS